MIYPDQHVHSNYSADSKTKIEEYVKKANDLGISVFTVADHVDLDFITIGNDHCPDFEKEKKELDEIQKKYPNMQLQLGVEIAFKDSAYTKLYNVLKNNNFDLINLAIHEADGIDFYYKEQIKKIGVSGFNLLYLSKVKQMINEFPDFDVVCHFDYAFKTCFLADNSLKINEYEQQIMDIFKLIIKKDKCLEINTKVQNAINDEHTLYILSLYKKLGGKNITLSSDAHYVDAYHHNFDHYISLIKMAGFDHLNYFVKRVRKDYCI